jgi:cell division GTPase FtsZ
MNVDADVIWGWVVDEALGENVRVTVIATGLPPKDSLRAKAQPTIGVDASMKSPSITSTSSKVAVAENGTHTDRVAKVVVNHTLDFDLPSFHDEH